MSQRVDVARWLRPAKEHAQDVLFWWVRPEVRVIVSCSHFGGSCFCSTFCALFITGFFFCCFICVFFSKIKLFVLGLSFDFLVFCYFVFRPKSSLQKNNLSSSKLVLIQFGYRGFSFLCHTVRMWFVVFSRLALVSLDYYKIPFQPG